MLAGFQTLHEGKFDDMACYEKLENEEGDIARPLDSRASSSTTCGTPLIIFPLLMSTFLNATRSLVSTDRNRISENNYQNFTSSSFHSKSGESERLCQAWFQESLLHGALPTERRDFEDDSNAKDHKSSMPKWRLHILESFRRTTTN